MTYRTFDYLCIFVYANGEFNFKTKQRDQNERKRLNTNTRQMPIYWSSIDIYALNANPEIYISVFSAIHTAFSLVSLLFLFAVSLCAEKQTNERNEEEKQHRHKNKWNFNFLIHFNFGIYWIPEFFVASLINRCVVYTLIF